MAFNQWDRCVRTGDLRINRGCGIVALCAALWLHTHSPDILVLLISTILHLVCVAFPSTVRFITKVYYTSEVCSVPL